LIVVSVLAIVYNLVVSSEQWPTVSIDRVAEYVKNDQVEKIIVKENRLEIDLVAGQTPERVVAQKEDNVGLGETLRAFGVSQEQYSDIKVQIQPPSPIDWVGLLSTFVPIIGFGLILLFMVRQAQSGNNQAISFGKSRARLMSGDQPQVTFEDVAGVAEAKQELEEVVEFLREPEKFRALGARIPKGVLLVGPPGTGKTLLARAVAGEAGVPFFSISGSEFVEMFVGVGASRVRDLFDQAKRNSPCIVFVDEVDAVGRHRGAGLGGSHDEREQTLNQILVEMDGFDTDERVIVMAATNRPDILDPALTRPGRFDRRVILDMPDMNGRRGILEVHIRGKPLAPDVDLDSVARQTPGFTGADIENLVNEAAILAARRNRKTIAMADMVEAIERVIAGPERRSRLITEEEKKITAYHEAAHALVAMILPNCDPVRKISIIPRGMGLGYTLMLPDVDEHLKRKSKFEDELAALLAGRAAEELIFGDVTTGAGNDLEKGTKLARAMVMQYGMNDELGPRVFGQKEELVFLGKEISEQRDYSEEIAQQIDAEIKSLITKAYDRAKGVLTDYQTKLEEIANLLIEKETLNQQEFEALFA
jgi:cell division protease FtsH